MKVESWRAEAACLGMDPNFFFDNSNLFEVRQRCLGCPVYDDCKAWCTDPISVEQAPYGIFAGYTAEQRLKIAGGQHVGDWRERARYQYRDKNGKVRTSRNVTTPEGEVKRAPTSYEQKLQRAAARPQCPNCSTGIDVVKQRKRADGTQVWRHLPCGTNYTEQEAA